MCRWNTLLELVVSAESVNSQISASLTLEIEGKGGREGGAHTTHAVLLQRNSFKLSLSLC